MRTTFFSTKGKQQEKKTTFLIHSSPLHQINPSRQRTSQSLPSIYIHYCTAMKSIELSILLIFYLFGTATAQKESLLAAETSLDLNEELEGRKLKKVCVFCPNGIPDPDLVLPTDNGATCGQAAELAQTLDPSDPTCAILQSAQVICCPSIPSPTLKPTDAPTLPPTTKPTMSPTSPPTTNPTMSPTSPPTSASYSMSMSAFYSGKGGKRRSGGKSGKSGGGNGKGGKNISSAGSYSTSMSVGYGGKGGKSGRGKGGKR